MTDWISELDDAINEDNERPDRKKRRQEEEQKVKDKQKSIDFYTNFVEKTINPAFNAIQQRFEGKRDTEVIIKDPRHETHLPYYSQLTIYAQGTKSKGTLGEEFTYRISWNSSKPIITISSEYYIFLKGLGTNPPGVISATLPVKTIPGKILPGTVYNTISIDDICNDFKDGFIKFKNLAKKNSESS